MLRRSVRLLMGSGNTTQRGSSYDSFDMEEALEGINKQVFQMPFSEVPTRQSIEQLLKKSPRNVQTFQKNLIEACPIVHTRVMPLLRDFIRLKQAHGNQLEKTVFANATPATLIQRFLRCRPLVFLESSDTFVLRNSNRLETVYCK